MHKKKNIFLLLGTLEQNIYIQFTYKIQFVEDKLTVK